MQVRCDTFGATRDRLGECPLWDTRDQSLYWVDGKARLVRRQRGSEYQEWPMPSDVGSIALTERRRLLLALEDGFHIMDLDTGAIHPLAAVQHHAPATRMNDGRTDRQGRFVAGSMVHGRHDPEAAFYQLSPEGGVIRLFGGIAVANATCFSPDGRTLYYADSLGGTVNAAAYDPVSGAVGDHRILFDTRPYGSGPDGAAVDAEGCLWVALVLVGQVARFHPDGRLLTLLDVPTPYPTCPCFGGPDLDILYLTSISDSGNLLRSDHPNAGAVIAVSGLGVRGLEEVRYDDRAIP